MAELTKAIARLMQERDRQQDPLNDADPPRLRDVLDLLRGKVAPGERPLAEALARQLFDRGGAELLSTASSGEVASIAISIFRLVQERAEREPRVVVSVPPDTGWDGGRFVVQTWMRDRPFIVDTVLEALRAAGCVVRRLLHPMFAIERDQRGAMLAISVPGELGQRESVLYVEVDQLADPEQLTHLLLDRLTLLVHATNDYPAMRNKAAEIADELRSGALPRPWNADVDEIAAFLDWLGEKNFVFLGYREYKFSGLGAERSGAVRRGSGLGVLHEEPRSSFWEPRPLPPMLRRHLSEPPLVLMSKTTAESPIHRRAHMDYIGIKDVDGAGVVVGERRFLGLYTAHAYAQEPMTVPLLRMKLASILEAEGASESSHTYNQIVEVFSSLTRVELLALGTTELHAVVKAILEMGGGTEVRVVQHPDPLRRGAFVVVIVPRERFSNELSRQIESRLLELLAARAVLERRLVIDERDHVRLHFYLAPSGESVRSLPADELRAQVSALLRTWDDRLAEALLQSTARDRARELATRYAGVFSAQYKAATDVTTAVCDVACLEALVATRTPQLDVLNPEAAAGSAAARFTVIKLYLAGEDLVLSDFLPVLENLGLKVFAQEPIDLTVPNLGPVRVHSFFVLDARGNRLAVDKIAGLLRPALLLLYRGRLDNDRLNALILSAALDWRQVDLLRTYVNHGVQIGTSTSRDAIISALVSHPASATALWRYFEARFNPLEPAAPREREKIRLPELSAEFIATLEQVDSFVEDRILRGLLSAVAATVRTNYFRPDAQADGPGALAIKLDCRQIPQLPLPRPLYEVYVHAVHVEGTHLRGAKVARGGIRLSDRPDDFRTEVLDLMSTQMVKNAVIVPAGAKGGFVLKRRAGMTPSAAEVVAAYRTFIGTLLDLTDNIVQGRVESPAGLLLYDDLDPYLVIAADKGTASFSDIANAIAAERKFWLGDAFASGGSYGYDHKQVGITARGTWECVKRHFRELGRDAECDTLTVVGIGDMSGDVFGNGLLLSRRFKLLAAFNHLHIFLDPNPDPARSFNERERLFRLPRSAWSDYSAALLSEGGGIYARSAKRIPLSSQVRSLLGLPQLDATGDEVVRAILRIDADLLWNGGVGTYVKATDESNLSVADRANDAVRVDGRDLRVKVVAEGGNLGLTQRGRIEYALHGGRLDTDAIDNSGGVDMSDHEVNLKICLGAAIDAGQLAFAERNRLLAELEPDVAQRVLAHNRRQGRVLSLDQQRSQTQLDSFREHMAVLESGGSFDRRLADLPDREMLRNRRALFLGLTRPELAVLLAHSKLTLRQDLLASAVPDDPFFERCLRGYFADGINQRFAPEVRSHRLRREIIAVDLANGLIDMMGMTFARRIARDTGHVPERVVRAWSIVGTVSDLPELWEMIVDADPPLPLPAEAHCALLLEKAMERAVHWFLETQPEEAPAAEMVEALAEPVGQLLPLLSKVLTADAQAQLATAVEGLAVEGAPRALAERVVTFDRLAELLEISEIAAGLEMDRPTVAEAFYRLGDLVDLDWLRLALSDLPVEDRWERRAVAELTQALAAARRQLTIDILSCAESAGAVDLCLQEYAGTHSERLAGVADVINDIKGARRPSLAALIVAIREVGRLVGETA